MLVAGWSDGIWRERDGIRMREVVFALARLLVARIQDQIRIAVGITVTAVFAWRTFAMRSESADSRCYDAVANASSWQGMASNGK
jgi:hypothetical protein